MIQTIKDYLSSAWTSVQDFFLNSLTIFYARLQTIVGTVVAFAGAIDWSSIASLDWTTPKQTLWIGIGLAANGIITELARWRTLNA